MTLTCSLGTCLTPNSFLHGIYFLERTRHCHCQTRLVWARHVVY